MTTHMISEEEYRELKGFIKEVRDTIEKLRKRIKYARDNPINEGTEQAAQTQLDLLGIFEEELGL